MHSAAQTQLLTLPPVIMASCCAWDKSMVDSDCSPKAFGSCVILTVDHVCCVAPYGKGDATCAVLATAIHHFANLLLGTRFRTAGSLGIKAMQLDPQMPQRSQLVPPGESLDDSPLPNCPVRNIVLT